MRIFVVFVYVCIMAYFLLRGFYAAFAPMLIFALLFIACLPKYREHTIRVAKKKIIDAQKAKQKGEIIKPFIEINSSPWYVLAELPGISNEMAKRAVELRRQNGPYPALDVFISILHVKYVYIEHIKAVAYVKNEMEPINGRKTENTNNNDVE